MSPDSGAKDRALQLIANTTIVCSAKAPWGRGEARAGLKERGQKVESREDGSSLRSVEPATQRGPRR